MPVVHALWTRARTLALWVEAPRRRPGAARPADAAALAAQAPGATLLAAALARPARGRLVVDLPCTPAGRPAASTGRPRDDLVLAPVELDVVELRGREAVDVLLEVAGPAAGVCSDGLRWLGHVARSGRAAVDGGSVVPDLTPRGDDWSARWVPLPDRRFHRWRSAVAEAAPVVLRAQARPRHRPAPTALDLLDDVVGLVVDVLVADRTAGSAPGPAPASPAVRAWLTGLRTGAPVVGAGNPQGLQRRVRDWQRSGDDSGYDLVLRVVEPEPWEDVDVDWEHRPGAEHPQESADPERAWRLQARLRPVDDPSLTLTVEQARAEGAGSGDSEDPLLLLLTGTARAGAVHPPLRRVLSGGSDAAS